MHRDLLILTEHCRYIGVTGVSDADGNLGGCMCDAPHYPLVRCEAPSELGFLETVVVVL